MRTTKNVKSEETRVYNNVKGNIVAVTLPKGIDGRVTISLDCEPFPSIDFETGEEITKSAFGINIRNLVNQVGEKVEAIGLANALATGKAITPQIISLALLSSVQVDNDISLAPFVSLVIYSVSVSVVSYLLYIVYD